MLVGQLALVSEAVRGEGAVLYDGAGRRVMAGVHPQEDLAPRDVVAAAISARMAEAPGGVDDHVFLDATHLGERFYERFPAITAACREAGIDPARDRIPVAPAAHYACGGVPARLDGSTALAGLFAVGEVSCTGVHGANRLASNSLTESVVAGTRVGRDLAWELPERVEPAGDRPGGAVVPTAHRPDVRAAMSRHVGVGRDAASLAAAADILADRGRGRGPGPRRRAFVVGDHEPRHRGRGGRRRGDGARGEQRVPPADRLPRAPAGVAPPPRRRARGRLAAGAGLRSRRRHYIRGVADSTNPSQRIDERIEELGDWRGDLLGRLRALVKDADPDVVEGWKWRGVPTWEHDGILCTGETYKDYVKMTFAKGASLDDPTGLFNASLEGNTRRAIDFREDDEVDEKALTALVRAAVDLNTAKARR